MRCKNSQQKPSLVQVTGCSAVVPTTMEHLYWSSLPHQRNNGCHLKAGTEDNLSLRTRVPDTVHISSHLNLHSNTIQSVFFFFPFDRGGHWGSYPHVSATKCLSQSQSFLTSASHCSSQHCDSVDTAALVPRIPFLLGVHTAEMSPSTIPTHLHKQEASPHFSPSSLKVKR